MHKNQIHIRCSSAVPVLRSLLVYFLPIMAKQNGTCGAQVPVTTDLSAVLQLYRHVF